MNFNKKPGRKPDRLIALSAPRFRDERKRDYPSRVSYDVIRKRGLAADFPRNDNDFLSHPLSEQIFSAWFGAAKYLLALAKEKPEVVIFGDYDCDGVCSTMLMRDFLNAIGIPDENLRVFIPNRIKDRYGLELKSAAKALAGCSRKPGLFIAVDCGSPDVKTLERLKAWGIPTLVIDHHLTDAAGDRHPATYHLNPKGWPEMVSWREDYCEMCAAGLVFHFCKYAASLDLNIAWDMKRALILAGLATTADQVPLRRVNRRLVREAISCCNVSAIYGGKCLEELLPGLQALHELGAASYVKAMGRLPLVNEDTFGFDWGPCINASGRLDSALLSYELLRETDPKMALSLAKGCARLNRARKYQQDKILEEARQQALAQHHNNPPAKVIVVASSRWHTGVVGIVASRLKEEFCRPVIVCGRAENMVKAYPVIEDLPQISWAEDQNLFFNPSVDQVSSVPENEILWSGSGRSLDGFDLGQLLHQAKNRGIILKGGGHKLAGGLTMTESQRPALMRWLNENCQLNDSHFEHRVEILMDLKEAQGDYQSLSEALRQLAPYGQGNPPLRFYLENVCLKYMEFFKPKRDDNNQQIDILLKPRPIRVKKDRQRWTVVGHFETTEESKQTFCVFWRNFDRVRREWRLHNYYTLEVEIRCKQDREFMDVNHFLVVRDCWQELDKVQPPRLGRYKPGVVAAILQRQNMLPSLQPNKLLTRENPKMKMKSDEVNYRLAQLALKYPYRKERGEK